MSRLDELINELCPEGVEYHALADVSTVDIGEFVHKNKQGDSMPYPVFNGGRTNTGMYDDYNHDGKYILVSARGANAGYVNSIDGRYWAGNSCYSIGVDEERVDFQFAYHYIKKSEQALLGIQQRGSIPAVSKKQIEQLKIPVPPLEVQREIVRILDTFTELTTELTAELTARKKQYEYCMMTLFENIKASSDRIVLSELCEIEKGKTPIQKAVPGEYPLVVTTSERKSSDTYQFESKSVCIPLVSSRGHGVASLNHVYYQEGKFALGNILCAVTSKDEMTLNPKYLFYYFEHTKDFTLVPLMKGGANVSLHISDIQGIKIPVPSIDEQNRIVSILETLDDYLSNDAGLPAEIEARKKQYEHYRDKLLTFKEKEA